MAEQDRRRWDQRYEGRALDVDPPAIPAHFATFADRFTEAGTALEVACGTGGFAVWLAEAGVHVTACDISSVAIGHARQRAVRAGVSERCTFLVADLDRGLPAGDPVGLVVCNRFRDARLDHALLQRLRPGGLLAIAVLSEVGAESGRFRARPGELLDAFSKLTTLAHDESDGLAWFVGHRASDQ